MKSFCFVVTLVFLSATYSCEGKCELPWVQPEENSPCYFVSTTSVNFYQADKFCKQIGGHLAEPRTQEETQYLETILSEGRNYWIGLTDLANEGEFLWWSDYSIPNYTNWDQSEPNNYDGNEDCTESSGYRLPSFRWNDVSCMLNKYAICQKSE